MQRFNSVYRYRRYLSAGAVMAALVWSAVAMPAHAQWNCGFVKSLLCRSALNEQRCPSDDQVCVVNSPTGRDCSCMKACNAHRDCAGEPCVEGRCTTVACNAPADCSSGFGCVEGACAAQSPDPNACTSNEQCSDRNPCNGVETCNMATQRCVVGAPVVCTAPPNQSASCRAVSETQTECVVSPPKACSQVNLTGGSLRMGVIGRGNGRRGFILTGMLDGDAGKKAGTPGNLRLQLGASNGLRMTDATLGERGKNDASGWVNDRKSGLWKWTRQNKESAIDQVTLTPATGKGGGWQIEVRGKAPVNSQDRLPGREHGIGYVAQLDFDWTGPDSGSICSAVVAPVCVPFDSPAGSGLACRARPVRM